MQVARLPPGNMSKFNQIQGTICPEKDLDHQVGIDYLSEVCDVFGFNLYYVAYQAMGKCCPNCFTLRAGSSVKPQISSATNAACNSNSNVTYLVSCRPPWTVEEGDVSSFFFGKDLELALAPKMCPDQSQAFKEVNNSQALTVGRKKVAPFFSGRAASRCSKACLHKVSRKYSKNWLRRINIKSNSTPEIEYTLKPSNYDAKPWFLHFTAQKSKWPRCFWEMDPEICTRV